VARGRVRIFGQPNEYISLSRARWLISARRARFMPSGELQILCGTAHSLDAPKANPDGEGPPIHWSEFSGEEKRRRLGTRWLSGYRMNGGAINRGL
jgi:hypothetical protein